MSIRLLIVDDSAFMRKAISMILEEEADIEVVGTAKDGLEAIEKVKRLRPDVVTLDIEMPRMDGLTALRRIMQEHPVPVIMISSLTYEGARETIQALELGAIDFIPKQFSFVSIGQVEIKEQLIQKIRAAAQSRFRLLRRRISRPAASSGRRIHFPRLPSVKIIVIGISTGGPLSLQKVIPRLPAEFSVPIAIVQHMPPNFTRLLAERLDNLSALRVVEAQDNMPIAPGTVYVAPGGWHLCIRKRLNGTTCCLSQEPKNLLFRPSADVLFESASRVFGKDVLAIVMTGMGKDGLKGAQIIKAAGGKVIAQDEETSVVYGMPRVVVEAGLADAVLPLEKIPEALSQAVGLQVVPA
ncbi:MAG: chemotaxis response regulator protein-glutamate methylesterase [Calditrichaeota bacterium]|nr:chemotaxis response regulator protein-glutamate methylesterase [Calditrichota bacterium]